MAGLYDLLGLMPQATYNMATDPVYGGLFGPSASGVGGAKPAGPGGMRGPNVGPGGAGVSHWEDVARQMAARRGWTGQDWRALDQIATAESGWNPKAVNPSSGAAGIPQMLPSAHPDINVQQFLSNPMQQIRWYLNYIQQRYGTPTEALDVRNQQGWY